MRYAFIKDYRLEFRVRSMCRVLKVVPSGFYKWLLTPKSRRQLDDEKLFPQRPGAPFPPNFKDEVKTIFKARACRRDFCKHQMGG